MQDGNALIKVDLVEKVGVESGMKVGDLGCGNLGFFSFPAAKAVSKDGIVYAVDILKPVLSAVESKARQDGYDNIQTVWSNLEMVGATKIQEGSLDIALLVNMLFQSKKDDLVIREASRLVKRGGKVVVVDWLKIAAPFGPAVEDRTNPDEIKKFSVDAGLKLLDEFDAGPYHYGIVFEKAYK